jgi:NADH-quinone oxidoreductase subunit G
VGVADGAGLVVSTAAGQITLPVVIDELPDFVVWLPANSQSSTVHESLRVGAGAVVDLAPAGTDLQPELSGQSHEGGVR